MTTSDCAADLENTANNYWATQKRSKKGVRLYPLTAVLNPILNPTALYPTVNPELITY